MDTIAVGPASATTTHPPSATASDPIQVNSGDSAPVTFDELNEIDAQTKLAKKAEKQQVKEIAKETAKELAKGDEKKASKKEEKEDEKQPEAKAKEDGKEEAKAVEAKDKPQEKKTIKAKVGDKDLDLDVEAKIPVKINGKEELVSLKDLQSNFSGKAEWDKRFTQLDKERKEFKSKTQVASEKIKAIFDEADPELRLVRMAEYAGQDPVTFRDKWLEDGTKLLEKWYTMSDAEKEADRKDFENKILKSKLESREKQDKMSQALGELDTKVQNLRKAHNVPEEDFLSRYDELESMQKAGKFKGEITPEFIVETIAKDRLWDAAEQKINALNVKLPQERRGEILLEFVDNAYKLGLSEQDVQEAATQIWGTAPKEQIVQEKLEQREEFLSGKKSVKKSNGSAKEVVFFDEI